MHPSYVDARGISTTCSASIPSMTLNGLHSTILLEISKYLGSKSTANLAITGRDICLALGTEAKTKRRLHSLRMVLIRLRFISNHSDDRGLLSIARNSQLDTSRERLIMLCVINLMTVYEYTGPPIYLYHFNPPCYNTLASILFHFEDHMNICVSNMYGLVRSTPTDVLQNLMFNFDGIMDDDTYNVQLDG